MSLNAQLSVWASTQDRELFCRLAQLNGLMAYVNEWHDERYYENIYANLEYTKDATHKTHS